MDGRIEHWQIDLYYKGYWDASTNTPEIADLTGNEQDWYRVSVSGTWNGISFNKGDDVWHDGEVWGKINSYSISDVTTDPEDLTADYTRKAGEWVKNHKAVTINATTPNGLSVSNSQVISMALADATHVGALSAADWLTFSGKQAALNGTGLVRMSGTTVTYDANVYVIKSGDTGLGNMTFNNNAVIDVASSVGTDVLNIGTGNADTINIGYSGSTININGVLSYQSVDNLTVKDKLITLNKGGGVESGVSSGFEIEENSLIKGWFTTSAARTGFELRPPANNYSAIFLLSSLSAERTYTFPDTTGTVALLSNIPSVATMVTQISENTSDNRLTKTDGATGRVIQQTGVTVDDSQNVTGVNTIATTSKNAYYIGSKLMVSDYSWGGDNANAWLGGATNNAVTGTGGNDGNYIAAIGIQSLISNTTGTHNGGFNHYSLRNCTSGSYDNAIGVSSMYTLTTGSYDNAFGVNCLYDLTTGSKNTALGHNTGRGITVGINNSILGANVTGLDSALSDNIILATGQGIIRSRFDGTNWNFYSSIIAPSLKLTGTSTGGTTISSANTSANDYTQSVQARTGTIANLDNETYVGTTAIALNRASLAQTLTGVSIDGTAAKATNLVGGNNTTLLGSIPYQSNTDATTLLAPNTTTTLKLLSQTGDATNGAAPSWKSLADAGIAPAYTGLTTNYLMKYNGTIPINSQIFDNGTNVAIGATSSSGKLHIQGATAGVSLFLTDAVNSTLQIAHPGSALTVFKNGSDAVWMSELDGKVGIGFTSPLSKLAINGGLHVGGESDAGDNNLLVDGTTTSSTVKITTGATINYYWKCTNADGSGSWAAISDASVYKGTWDANSNSPTLANGSGTAGWWYRVTTAGTNLGYTFSIGDDIWYNGSTWERVPGQGYTLQTATDTVLGGVKIGSGITITDSVISVSTNYQAPLSGSGIVKSASGAISYLTDNSSNWDSAYTFTSGFTTNYPDLTAIEALSGASGFLKKTAANTWSLDTNTYLTGITKSMIEAQLTGAITSHSHSYDNYGGWWLYTNGTSQKSVTAGNLVGFTAGSGISISYASDTVTIAVDTFTIATRSFVVSQGYLTSITKSQVEAVLTGAITSHSHSYDNYGGWWLYTNGTSQKSVTAGNLVGFTAGSGISISYASDTITIAASGSAGDLLVAIDGSNTGYKLQSNYFELNSSVIRPKMNSSPTLNSYLPCTSHSVYNGLSEKAEKNGSTSEDFSVQKLSLPTGSISVANGIITITNGTKTLSISSSSLSIVGDLYVSGTLYANDFDGA